MRRPQTFPVLPASAIAALVAALVASSLASASVGAPSKPAPTTGAHGARGASPTPGKHVRALASLAAARIVNPLVNVPHGVAAHVSNAQSEPGSAKPKVVIGGSPVASIASPRLSPSSARATANAPVTGTILAVSQSESGQTPPDPIMAAGPLQIVVMTNGRIKAFTKVGILVPNSSMSLGQFFSSLSGAADGPFDPKTAFDPYINRFWAMSVSRHFSTGNGDTDRSSFLIAISDTSDVTQGWTFFQMDAKLNGNSDSGRWCDYPQLGFDSQAVYFTCNMFPFSNLILPIPISKVRILLKTEFTGGGCCTWWDQWGFTEGFLGLIPSFTIQPAKMYGAGNSDGEWMIDSHTTCIGDCSDLEVFHITNAENCCSGSSGPTFDQTSHGVGSFPGPTGGRQSGSSTTIDTGDTRLLYAIWQNGHLSTGQDLNDGSGNSSVSFTELDVSGGIGSINTVQDWQFTNSGVDYYYPAVDTNAAGDKAMVMSRSGPTEFVSTRLVTIPNSGTCHNCTGPEIVLANGDSTYVQIDPNGNRDRWGDYSGAAADPDGTGIWVHGEFAAASGLWATAVGLAYEPIETDLGLTGLPADITVDATSTAGAVVTYASPTAVDDTDNPPASVSCTPASGSTFAIGTTIVTCTASSADDTPSTVSQSFAVTVNDTDLGIAGVPANITVNATSTSGAVVTYATPTAVDEAADNPVATASCAPASGSTFPIGLTTVTCTATSADDNPSTVSQSFTVTVNDTDLGIAAVPANITTDVNSPLGAVVTWTSPTAVDEAADNPAPTVSCSPASGSTFPLGTTTVTCTASSPDDNPGAVSGTFNVTVMPTAAGITNVVNQLLAAGCINNHGIANALIAKLKAAQKAIAAGHFKQAINILKAFIHQVQAQDGKHILAMCTINGVTFSPAAELIADAQSLINSVTAMMAPRMIGHRAISSASG